MGLSFTSVLLGLVAIIHFFTAMLATFEVADYPLFTIKQKIVWQLVLWLVPILGALLVHNKLDLANKGGSGIGGTGTGGEGTSGGGGGGCDGFGGGDC